MTISATQDAPVFTVPPRGQEPPQKEEAADPYPAVAAQVLRLIGEFDGSRMGYGEDDAQAMENIARQLHGPVQREELYELLRSFLDHADPEEEIAVDVALCLEQIEGLPPALTPEQTQREEIKTYLDEAGYAASDELIEDGIAEYHSHGGKGNSRDIAGFIERELLAEEPAAETMPSGHADEYRLVGRLKADCDYFLGAGGRAEKHLWAGNVREQIAKMRELYALLPEKPEWLTMEDIDRYAQRMEPPFEVVVYHHFENGFDEKLDYQTLAEAEQAAQQYVAGTMEGEALPTTALRSMTYMSANGCAFTGISPMNGPSNRPRRPLPPSSRKRTGLPGRKRMNQPPMKDWWGKKLPWTATVLWWSASATCPMT